jgi:uncharacterized repeat protein (TIGR01451 family)
MKMKKILLILPAFLLAAGVYAETGTADISPAAISPGQINPVLSITYKPGPGSAGNFSGGAVAVQINQTFTPAPSTTTTDGGYLSVIILLGGITPTAVAPENITIDGYAVTINSVSLGATDSLVITYGNTGSSGLYGPVTPGAYVFYMSEKTTDAGSFAPLDKSPVLYVTNLTLSKSCSLNTIKAGNTFTYTISYNNNDANNSMTRLTIWDTLPPDISYVSATPTAVVSGNYLSWNIGNIGTSIGNSITVAVTASANIYSYGANSVNTVSASAFSTASGNNSMTARCSTGVIGMNLQISISAGPITSIVGSMVTVLMNITNAGNLAAVSVAPSVLNAIPTAGMTPVSTPNPPSLSSLAAGTSYTFTWTFLASTAGTYHFSSHAYADDNTAAYMSPFYLSNGVVITIPTPTSTRTPTFTATPTWTFTATFTATPTDTPIPPVSTDTPVIIATATPITTNVATPVKINTPVSTPVDKVNTDKNYINTGRDEQVVIKYKVEKDGESSIRIFNLNGEQIRDFHRLTLHAGVYTALWDGTNDLGKKAGKGIYFIVVKQPGGQTIKKLVVIK